MKIVLTGSTGLLGKYLISTQPKNDAPDGVVNNEHQIIPLFRSELTTEQAIIHFLFKIQPDIIINCAANGDVDSVECSPSEAVKADLLGTIHLKEYCEKMNCKLVTISSNAVYSGERPPYNESDKRAPVNFYGKIKSLSDDIVMQSSCEWMIIRPILMYGYPNISGRSNWVTRIINSREDLKVVDDSFSQPTYAGDVAKSIWHLIAEGKWGESYNVATDERISLYEFAKMVKQIFELDVQIDPIKLSELQFIAPRPVDTCFDVSKLEKTGFCCNTIVSGLMKMKNEKI